MNSPYRSESGPSHAPNSSMSTISSAVAPRSKRMGPSVSKYGPRCSLSIVPSASLDSMMSQSISSAAHEGSSASVALTSQRRSGPPVLSEQSQSMITRQGRDSFNEVG